MKIPQIIVELDGNFVRLELRFRDRYEAVVYHDDLCQCLKKGGVKLGFTCPPQEGRVEIVEK